MKIFKKAAALSFVAVLLFLAACGGGDPENEKLSGVAPATTSAEREVKTRLAAVKDDAGLIIAKLSADRSYAYETTFFDDVDRVVALLKNAETDAAVLPLETAARVYNDTNGGVQIISVGSLPSLCVVSKDKSVINLSALKGKTVAAAGKGGASELFFKQILSKNGIDPENDVNILYKASEAEVAAAAEKGEADAFALSEPSASGLLIKDGEYFRAIDLSAEWQKAFGFPFVRGCVAVGTEYIRENPEIVKELRGFCEISSNFIGANPESAVLFLLKNKFFNGRELARSVVAGLRFRFLEGPEMKKAASQTLEKLFGADPEIAGGRLPGDAFYYGA